LTSLEQLRAFIAQARWIFARTMPEHPHWYTLRKENPQVGFEAFVLHIRKNGYEDVFQGRAYTKLDIDDWTYWTMGAPLNETILVNRARTRSSALCPGLA
jgi:hypothetical protein